MLNYLGAGSLGRSVRNSEGENQSCNGIEPASVGFSDDADFWSIMVNTGK